MYKLINTLIVLITLFFVTNCSSLLNNSADGGGYRVAQVREDNSLSEGIGKLMGVVKDADTDERLKKGEVFIYALNKRFPFREDGSFLELIPAGKYVISIQSEGYNPVSTTGLLIRTKTSTYLDVRLFPIKNTGASGPTN